MASGTPDMQAYLANLPAMQPPAGVQSNFNNPRTDGLTLIIVSTVFTALPFLSVILRLYVRIFISNQKIWWDDAICSLAVLTTMAHTTLMIKNLDYGLGKHLWDIRAIDMTHMHLASLLSMDDVVTVAGYLTRISILLLYYRLFKVYESSRRLIWIGMAACTLITIPYLGVVITRAVRCTDPLTTLVISFCSTRTTSTAVVTFASLNMTTDFFILVIPIHRFRGLNMNGRKKMGLIAIFAAGFLSCCFAAVRLVWVCVHFSDEDTLRYALWVGLFVILEVNIALTCNCAIFFPALWKARKSVFSINSLRRLGTSEYKMSKGISSGGKVDNTGPRMDSRESAKPIIQYDARNMELDEGILRKLEASENTRI